MSALMAFTVEQAARVTRVSARRIRYWDRTGVLTPSLLSDGDHRRAYNRIYSFWDLVGLKTLGELRDQWELPLQKLRAVGDYLKECFGAPWSTLRFHVVGRGRNAQVFFREPESKLVLSATNAGQISLFKVEPIAHDLERKVRCLAERAPEQIGQVTCPRCVVHGL